MQIITIALLALCANLPEQAEAWTVRTSQYVHTAWRTQDGLFNGVPQSLVQATDGYIWVGTSTGVVRFDGVHFVSPHPPAKVAPLLGRADALLAASDGSLWIGTPEALIQMKDDNFLPYPDLGSEIAAIVEDPKGGVWVGRSEPSDDKDEPLCHAANMKVQCFGKADGLAGRGADVIYRDGAGNLWVSTELGLFSGRPGSFTPVKVPTSADKENSPSIASMESGFNDSLLIGLESAGRGEGLQELKQGSWSPFTRPGFDGSRIQIGGLLKARDDSLWIGTQNDGIYVVRGQQVDHFGTAEGLSGNAVSEIFEDRESNIWAVTSDGIDCFRKPKVLTVSQREGLSYDAVSSALAARDGTVYMGNSQALDRIEKDKIISLRAQDGLPGVQVTVLLEDHLGRIWVGGFNSLAFLKGRTFTTVQRADNKPIGLLQEFIEDKKGDLWGLPAPIGPQLLHVQGTVAQLQTITPAGTAIYSVAPDPSGGILLSLVDGRLATYKDGALTFISPSIALDIADMLITANGRLLTRASGVFTGFLNGKPRALGPKNGIPAARVYNYILTRRGDLWLYTSVGLIDIEKQEFERWWVDPAVTLKYRLFDASDGVMASHATFRAAATEGPDGKLWFANDHKVQMIDPRNLPENTLPPPVHIEAVIGDRHAYLPRGNIRFPTHLRDLEIDYAALSFTAPEKVRFRYRLDGRDQDWQDPSDRRQAVYTDLHPGHYTFHVIASNNDGVWNTSGDSLTFFIPPAFYQTTWFRIMVTLATCGFLWLLYALRLRRATAELGARLGERLQERERIARALHDTLLQDFQAVILRFQLVANRLAKGDPRRAEVEDGLEYADKVLAEGREHIRDIRADTKAHEGLVESLTIYGRELTHMWPLEFSVASTGKPIQLHPVVRDEMYRIAREALGNAFRHSKGSVVAVKVSYTEEAFVMRICDDGVGVAEDILRDGRAGHWGISNMRERARKIGATLNLSSPPDGGTCIELRIAVELASGSRAAWFRLKRRRGGEKLSMLTRS